MGSTVLKNQICCCEPEVNNCEKVVETDNTQLNEILEKTPSKNNKNYSINIQNYYENVTLKVDKKNPSSENPSKFNYKLMSIFSTDQLKIKEEKKNNENDDEITIKHKTLSYNSVGQKPTNLENYLSSFCLRLMSKSIEHNSFQSEVRN